MKKFQLTRRSLIVSTRVAATVAIFLNLFSFVAVKYYCFKFLDFRLHAIYLAFWSSICWPEYIFLLGSWSTLAESVPSNLFAFLTFCRPNIRNCFKIGLWKSFFKIPSKGKATRRNFFGKKNGLLFNLFEFGICYFTLYQSISSYYSLKRDLFSKENGFLLNFLRMSKALRLVQSLERLLLQPSVFSFSRWS